MSALTSTLLCLPGLGGGAWFFEALAPLMVGVCQLIAVDPPRPCSFDDEAAHIVQIARASDDRDRDGVYLLGHSMGVIIAFEALRQAPALVRGVILVGGLPEPPPAARVRITARAEAIRQRSSLTGMGPEIAAANFSPRAQRDQPALVAWFSDHIERQDPRVYAATAESLAAWTARPLPPLDYVRCLVIAGDEDRYAPPDAIRAFAQTLPAGTPVDIFPSCGHLPFLEDPATVAARVTTFLR